MSQSSISLTHKPPGSDPKSKFERVHTVILDNPFKGSLAIAEEIAALIRAKEKAGEKCVLGLATGSSPKTVYKELIRMHKEEALSFKHVITFNLDEYFPMAPAADQSYVKFMHEQLFDHIDIPREQIHIPDGTVDKTEVEAYCHQYEQAIADAGGLDLQILGIGRTGHIGFNEPGSHINSLTRLVTLDRITKLDAADDFSGEQNVPSNAITMGINTILKAKRIILMAWGEAKSSIVQAALEGPISESIPSTYLQKHHNATFVIDVPAAQHLIRRKSPWLTGSVLWTDAMIKKAVVWLCQKVDKPILKLTDRDYNDNGLSELITGHGPAYNINIKIFNTIQHTITGWPGGKPGVDDSHRPERATPAIKRVLIFSPHPDDDVISMGGTLLRLIEQGHQVHVAYQTSGSIAVFDEEAKRYAKFLDMMLQNEQVDISLAKTLDQANSDSKKSHLLQIKKYIRRSEAIAALEFIGLDQNNYHFLDMPFYETGSTAKHPLSARDIQLVYELIDRIQPHQIFVAADLADPHGTHRTCYEAVVQALGQAKSHDWLANCYVWLYKGAWQEWDLMDIDMAVPLSPGELMKKRQAIFKHQSQKDTAPYPGNDDREFWQRAEERNKATARLYDQLGMAEYEAIEGFKRYQL